MLNRSNIEISPWLLIFINPVTFAVALFAVMSYCYHDPCPENKDIKPRLDVVEWGRVTMPNGEVCTVEEVVRVTPDGFGDSQVDPVRKCNMPVYRRTPAVRRLACPSGYNGQSIVGDDGTKFHNEVLQ